MTIDSKIRILTAVVFVICLVLASLFFYHVGILHRHAQVQSSLQELIGKTFALRTITFEYLLFREEGTLEEWNRKAAEVGPVLDAIQPLEENMGKQALAAIRTDLDALAKMLGELSAGGGKGEKQRLIVSQSLVKSQAIEEASVTLVRQANSRMTEKQNMAIRIFFISLVVLGLLLSAGVLFVVLGLLRPLKEIKNCMVGIQGGNMNLRTGIRRHDEIGFMAAAFDQMVEKIATLFHDQKEVEAELRQSEDNFKRLVKHLPIPLCFFHQDGALNYINDQFVNDYGYSEQEIPTLNAWWRLAYPDPDYRRVVVSDWEDAVERARFESREIAPREQRIACRDGTVRMVLVSTGILGGDLLLAFVDLTDRIGAETEVRRLNEELEKRIAERTEELKRAVAGLEEMNRVFVGRELKMAELKGRIAMLEKERS